MVTTAPRTGKLSPLEAEAIAAIYAHRVVSTTHLHAWLTPTATSSSYLRRALSFLRGQGLIGNLGRRGKRELLWYATTTGAAVAEDSRRVVPRIWRLDPARINTLDPSHTLAVNDLGTAVLASARQAGHEMTYLDWTQEIVHPTGPGGYAAFGSPHLVTDAVFRITTVDAEGQRGDRVILAEMDRATMTVARVAEKLAAYARYQRINRAHWRSAYGLRFPEVLIVLDNASPQALYRRAEDVRWIANNNPELQKAYGEFITGHITTLGLLQAYGLGQESCIPLIPPATDDPPPAPRLGRPPSAHVAQPALPGLVVGGFQS